MFKSFCLVFFISHFENFSFRFFIPVLVPLNDQTSWETFDEFKKESFAFYDVCFPTPLDNINWISGYCECKDYYKSYICEHLIGIAARLRFVNIPPEAKAIPLGQKRKRGRPAKSKKALEYQNY